MSVKLIQKFILVHSGPIGRPNIRPNCPQYGAPNTYVGNFFHNTPLNLNSVQDIVEKFPNWFILGRLANQI